MVYSSFIPDLMIVCKWHLKLKICDDKINIYFAGFKEHKYESIVLCN